MRAFGQWALWLALVASVVGSWAAVAGGAMRRRGLVRHGARSLHLAMLGLVVATVVLASGLITSDFTMRFVATFSSLIVPRAYRLGGLWGGAPGSLLVWTLALAVVTSVALLAHRRAMADRLAWFVPAMGGVVAVMAAVTAFAADPLASLDMAIREGRGLDGVLQNRWMLVHPPLLLAGSAATLPLFALTVAALGVRRLDEAWRTAARAWALIAWTLLLAGVASGMRWAYTEPGWGGYWAWDPVEVAGAIPLAILAVLLHVSTRRGTHPAERAILALAAFPATLIGAWVARGDTLRTVHGFAQTPNAMLFGLIASASVVLGVALIFMRRRWLFALSVDASPAAVLGIAARLSQVGVVLFVVGSIALPFRREYVTSLNAGERYAAKDVIGRAWTLTSQGESRYVRSNMFVVSVPFVLARAGRRQGLVVAEERQFIDADEDDIGEPVLRAGILFGVLQDVQVQVSRAESVGSLVRIRFQPLASLLWLGAGLLVLAAVLGLPSAFSEAAGAARARPASDAVVPRTDDAVPE